MQNVGIAKHQEKFVNNEKRLKRDRTGQEMRRALHKILEIDVKADEN